MSESKNAIGLQAASEHAPTAHLVKLVLVFTAFAAGCALNRSDVKSLRDRDASRIRLDTPIETTVAALNAIPAHCGPAMNHRVREEEFHVYEVIGRIARAKRERDHDIHIVLEDPGNPRARLVVESADPDSRGNLKSPYRDRLAVARRMFDELVRGAGARQLNDLRGIVVRVTGVGFFDLNHFQIGRSRSCIELHPILAIERVRDYSAEQVPKIRLISVTGPHSISSCEVKAQHETTAEGEP
jgi:hypothetical protein